MPALLFSNTGNFRIQEESYHTNTQASLRPERSKSGAGERLNKVPGRRLSMANKIDPKEVVPIEEALQMEMLINQALIDLLVTKGIITTEELLARIQYLRNPRS